ncbi:MAG TPA: diguanylate cyclase [Anaerolineae bacterium]
MENQKIKILHVEDNPGDIRLVRELLHDVSADEFSLVDVERLADALTSLASRNYDVILLDLSLPDSQGLETVRQIREAAARVPIVIMSGHNDANTAVEALKQGAQDYLEKSRLDGYWLGRAIRYAIERHRLSDELHALALIDDLTGIYNRRGFFMLAEQQIKYVRRLQNKLVLMYADMDELKHINDTFGHHEGDRALVQVSQILRKTIRDSDIVARIGGDEFALFAADAVCKEIEALPSRVQKNIDQLNSQTLLPYPLSISIGTVCCDFVDNTPLEELLNRADKAMYEQKQGRHDGRS